MQEQALRPQDRFLLAATIGDASASRELAEATRDRPFWAEALRLSIWNRLASLAWSHLNDTGLAPSIDRETFTAWQQAHQRGVLGRAVAQRQLGELAEALAPSGIAPLLYKGPDFSSRYHPEKSPRGFTDIDLIIEPDRVRDADATLRAAGYHPRRGDMPLAYFLRFHLHTVYTHPRWPFLVELHWAVDSPYAARQGVIFPVLESAIEAPEFGPGLRRPAPIDALALMAIHLKKHLSLSADLPDRAARLRSVLEAGGLVWLADVSFWLRSEVEASPDAVLARFASLDATDALETSLRLAADLDPASLPGWADAILPPARTRAPLLCRMVYPDLSRGGGATRFGERVRGMLMTPLPGLTFRPMRALEALLPLPRVPSERAVRPLGWRARLLRSLWIARLGAANLLWLLRWRLRRGKPGIGAE